MRKRLGILLLIFSLFIFFPTQKTYGQAGGGSWGTSSPEDALIGLLLFLPIWAISSYFSEDKKCDSLWHPGDYYYEKNYKIMQTIIMKVIECDGICNKKMDKSIAMGSLRSNEKNMGMNYGQCYNPCVIDAYKPFPTSVSTCKYEGIKGHYSDGSYYDSSEKNKINYRFFDNIHELKDQYEKNEWQKARDYCMQKVSENKEYMKRQWWVNKSKEYLYTPNQKGIIYYNDCLKERGY